MIGITVQIFMTAIPIDQQQSVIERLYAACGGAYTPDQRRKLVKAIGTLSPLPLWISDRTACTPSAIASSVRRRKLKGGLDLVIVDYLQLLSGGGRHERRVEEIGYISRALKLMAREHGVAVVALAQLNRDSEKDGRRPKLHDLRDSGSIEQDSDIVFLLHHNPAESVHELILAKHRNGPRGMIPLWFDEKHVRFDAPENNRKAA